MEKYIGIIEIEETGEIFTVIFKDNKLIAGVTYNTGIIEELSIECNYNEIDNKLYNLYNLLIERG